MITFLAVVVAGGAVFVAPYLGARVYHAAASLPVAATFRAFGTAAVPAKGIDVAPPVPRRALAAQYEAQHRGVGRATRREARLRRRELRRAVDQGVHRNGVASLKQQRARFSALSTLIRGGAR